MNRLDMSQEIAKRVPLLSKRDKDEWKNAEKIRREFVFDYPVSQIRSMTLDEYVIGKGRNNRSFCYRLEREMDSLGRILGATASKFGIYYGRTKSDPSKKYRFSNRWGKDKDGAFSSVKDAIVELLQAASKDDVVAIAKNRLSPMLKGKILFVYYPNQYAPIYAREHLEFFLAHLNISGSFRSNAEMQLALMKYRETWSELMMESVTLYMRLLYDIFGHPDDERENTESEKTPLLASAIQGAEFIQHMPEASKKSIQVGKKEAKLDYEKHQRRLKHIGDRGEAIVLAMEENRLKEAGRSYLASQIKHISEKTDRDGYDILSFDEDGTPRQIEVKATTGSNLDRGFYLSSNELEKARELRNYYIYFVFSALSKRPKILPLQHPALNGDDFEIYPVSYHVALKT